MTDIPIKIQFVKSLSNLKPSRVIVVKPDNATDFQLYITDKTGIPFPIKDNTVSGAISNVINTDGNLSVSGSSIKTINLSSSILAIINGAIQSGDNTSATAVSGNQLVTDDSWSATTTAANVRQRRDLTVQTHSAFTGNTELFIAVRKRVLSGSGMRALEFLLTFEEQ